jgi:hypothetical protein
MPSHSVSEQQYDTLLRQSRLAAPPLEELSHLSPDELAKELASFAPPATPGRQALLLNSVTATVSSLCKKLDDKLSGSQLLNLEDATWLRKMCARLAGRFKEMSEGNERLKETYARAIDASLRADIEDQIRGKSTHIRTVRGFIIQTLQELLEMLEQGKEVPHHFLVRAQTRACLDHLPFVADLVAAVAGRCLARIHRCVYIVLIYWASNVTDTAEPARHDCLGLVLRRSIRHDLATHPEEPRACH